MARLPLTPQIKPYRGGKRDLLRQWFENHARAERICDHVNRQIANNPAELQQVLFGFVAANLGLSKEAVWKAISQDGSTNGMTFTVTPEDRAALAKYKVA